MSVLRKTINLTLNGNRLVTTDSTTGNGTTDAGIQGENNAVMLRFAVPTDWNGLSVNLYAVNDSGVEDMATAVNGIVNMPLQQGLLADTKQLRVHIEGVNGTDVRKTNECILSVKADTTGSVVVEAVTATALQQFQTIVANIESETAADVISSASNASAAAISAASAANSANTAAASETLVANNAASASLSATNAANSATAASVSETNSANSATTASTSASAAGISANGAATAASTATVQASNAANSAALAANAVSTHNTAGDAHSALFGEKANQADLNATNVNVTANTNEINNINENLVIETIYSKNIIDVSKYTISGQLVNNASGSIVANSNYLTYDGYINVLPSTNYISSIIQGGIQINCVFITLNFYTSDNTFISGSYNAGATGFTTPNNCYRIRTSIAIFNITHKLVLQKGSQITDYEPYFEPYEVSKLNEIEESNDVIDCIGDSLTYGTGSTLGNSYPDVLKNLTGLVVNTYGFPGDGSDAISGYTGGTNLYIDRCTIPASGNVTISIKSYNNATVPFHYPSIVDSNNSINPVCIGNVQGNLDLSASTNNSYSFVFTRSNSGASKQILYPTSLVTNITNANANNIKIICIGQNGGWNSTDELAYQINAIINTLQTPNKRYIILGIPAGSTSSRSGIETKFEMTFGKHFINSRTYLLNYGLTDANITPTAQDNTDIQNGLIPTSLRSDSTHLNDIGYKSLANLVYIKGIELGYWN